MLQARTYLFCAIRPEVQFLKYTFATLVRKIAKYSIIDLRKEETLSLINFSGSNLFKLFEKAFNVFES